MSCKSGKARFDDEASALWTIETQNAKRLQRGLTPVSLYVYTCQDCGGLHLTKQPQKLPSMKMKARLESRTQEEIDVNDWFAEVRSSR